MKSLRHLAALIIICLFTVGKQCAFPGEASHMGKTEELQFSCQLLDFTKPIKTQNNKNNKNSHLTVGWMCVQKVSLQRDELCQVVTATSMSDLTLKLQGNT